MANLRSRYAHTRRQHQRRSLLQGVEALETRNLLTGIELTALGSYESGVFDESAAEIVAHDPASQRAFVTNSDSNSVVVVDINDPSSPTELFSIDVSEVSVGGNLVATGGVQSVAVEDGVVAVALAAEVETNPGFVAFYDTAGAFLGSVTVGALPDMLTFTPDGDQVLVANEGEPSNLGSQPAMATGEGGYQVQAIFTVGTTLSGTTGALNPTTAGDYTPPGILDGLGAMEHPSDPSKVRVFANHELLHFRGYEYEVSDGAGGTFSMSGARISYFDIDKETRQVVDAGLAYNVVYDANGAIATDTSFLANNLAGFSRFCSSVLVEMHQFGDGRGLEDPIYFAGEEDGGFFNPVGGAEWALDVSSGDLWHVPAMGRGAWENITEIDTGTTSHVAFILADDSSPFNHDGLPGNEVAPLYLYVGEKDTSASADFLERNGLRDGKLYVWVSDMGDLTPTDFNTSGTRSGKWVEVDNSPTGTPSEDGSTGFDENGYPTQGNLWTQAKALGAFGFSRPEDVATNPNDGTEIVLASTGVDNFEIDPITGNGVDTFGTIYTVKTDFGDIDNPTADITIIYDGDADPTRAIRSPDNLDWADDGLIYVQEDEAEEDTASGDEVLFGLGAANPDEAGILQLNPSTSSVQRVATIDRSVLLDPTTSGAPVDQDAGEAGEWETSGILDVSTLFGEAPGSLLLFDIQAHGLDDQDDFNPDSRLTDFDLAEGGQLAFLQRTSLASEDPSGSVSIIDVSSGVGNATVATATFEAFDGQEDELRAEGVRIFSGKSVSQDVEPEYIAVSPDGTTARVALQEANAFGVLDIASATITEIQPLGLKDHSLPGNGLDASDRDDAINIVSWPVFGMYMPDAIASFEVGGNTYFISANEGDDRGEDSDIEDIDLDPTAFPNAAELQQVENLGRLGVSTVDGDTDGDGDYDQLFSYGARSFTIWNADGDVVFDSGDQFEQITAAAFPDNFNADNDENDAEGRSDNKGPEPEAVTTGVINGRTFAFVGLERIGGIMVYDVSDPAAPEFVQYINNRDFNEDPELGEPGDLGVEDLKFISAEDSPNGGPLIVAANEVSGSVTIFQVSGSVFNDGVLELIGTDQNDRVRVRTRPHDKLLVSASFLPDSLTYSAKDVDQIRVSTLTGDDDVRTSPFLYTDMMVMLGAGNDYARTGLGNDILVGGDGGDNLRAGWGRNLLIGGAGRDRLNGGLLGGSILIGGTTAYDRDMDALDQIMAEWSSARSFNTRFDNISHGLGPVLGGTGIELDAQGSDRTVFDDGDRDRLKGGFFALDWFFADLSGRDADRILGFNFFDKLTRL